MSDGTLAYTITSVVDDQAEQPDGTLQNQFDITFVVPSLNNYSSSVSVPKAGADTVSVAAAAIEAVIAEVQAVYALGG